MTEKLDPQSTGIVIPPNTPSGDIRTVERLYQHMFKPNITTERRRQIRLKIDRILHPYRPNALQRLRDRLKRKLAAWLRYRADLLDGGQEE